MKYLQLMMLVLFLIAGQLVKAQDTLPKFTVEDKGGGRIVVSWSNPYDNLIQLAVQRSYDSIKKFSSVFSATSPELPLNGFSDKITPGAKIYYRIFYVMRGGTYYFTKSLQPGVSLTAATYDRRRDQLNEELVEELKNTTKATGNNEPVFLKTKDGVRSFMPIDFKNFRDSILTKTNDTLLQISADTILLQVYAPAFIQRSSQFVFTDRDGYIVVKLPDAATKKYDVIFMEEDDTPVLELNAIKDSKLTIDKSNFYHGGWYKFELKENGRVKERNKIFLPTDF